MNARELYLDIIEGSLAVYEKERIYNFIERVRHEGLSEHGFPRIGANIGLLMAYGRSLDYYPIFVEIMDICAHSIPRVYAANDFSVREVVCALALLEKRGVCDKNLIEKWKKEYAEIDPWHCYSMIAKTPDTPIGNWAMFNAVSEYVRCRWCKIDDLSFVDHEISSQLLSLDENGMYKDPGCPMIYDVVARFLMSAILLYGYDGKHREAMENALDRSIELTLKMQSVTGEFPYGGRSNQFIHNEPMLASLFEMEATRLYKKGETALASRCRAAAIKAAEHTLSRLDDPDLCHMKNAFPRDSFIGSEPYGYFDKYMITAASNISFALFFANENITPSIAPTDEGFYSVSTSEDFHKTFLNAHGYFLELDSKADFHYDANGLGRIHKKGCESTVCLSLPFPPKTESIKLECDNPRPMSLCAFVDTESERLCGSEGYANYTLTDSGRDFMDFDLEMNGRVIRQEHRIGKNGVDIIFCGADGFMLPVFLFDGKNETDVEICENRISVSYKNSRCVYTCDTKGISDEGVYHNRNGRYRIFAVKGSRVHIELGEKYEI